MGVGLKLFYVQACPLHCSYADTHEKKIDLVKKANVQQTVTKKLKATFPTATEISVLLIY